MATGSFKNTTSALAPTGDVGFGPDGEPVAGAAEPAGGAALPDFSLLSVVGTELAEPVATMQFIVQEYVRRRFVTDKQMKLLHGAVEATKKVAVQTQQIARLAHGKLRQSHERLKLDELLQTALTEHARDFQKRGVELSTSIRPVEIIVDPGLLISLLDAAISWAMSIGQKLFVSLDMKNWPEHGVLFFKASQSIAAAETVAELAEHDSLAWHLLHQLAQTMGVSVDRVKSDNEAILLLEFPRTVRQLEGLTAVEVDTGFDSLQSESRALAGHRLLVVTEDEKLRFDIKMIIRTMGLEVDFVSSTKQAVRFCELDLPHMIIIDERLRDHVFDELREDLVKSNPNFPFLEIAIESNTLEIAGWMSDSMARVSRDSLRSQLPSILALELAKIM